MSARLTYYPKGSRVSWTRILSYGARLALAARLTLAAAAVAEPCGAAAQTVAIIDTHAHLDNPGFKGNFHSRVEGAVARMNKFGIGHALLAPPPMPPGHPVPWDIEMIRFAKEAYPGRFSLVGGGGTLNPMIHGTGTDAVTEAVRKAFRARAEQILAAGGVGFGEIALHHMSIVLQGPQHPYESVPADHTLLLLLADIAAENGVPMDVHFDLVPADMPLPERPVFNRGPNPAQLKANMAAFERLLAHNRSAKILWAHAGSDPLMTRIPGVQRELLTRHPNLFMSLRLGGKGPPPSLALDQSGKLKPFWLQLLQDFPERFVIGTDFFHTPGVSGQHGVPEESLENYRAVLAQLPRELAEAIGHGNAERIFRLPVR
jgi:predicted TIM-barrel fold metal-dependent hydrolase